MERASLTNHINLADFIGKKERYPLSRFYYTYEQGLLYGGVPDKFFEFIFDEIRKKSEEYDILKMYTVLLIQDIKIKYMTIKKTFFFSLWLSRIIFMEKS